MGFTFFWNEFFYRPLFNGLFFIYQLIGFYDLGIAIILLTALVRLILLPVFHKSIKTQVILQKIQPEIRKIQEEYKNEREVQARKMMDIYKEHNINPFSGFLFLLLQIPIFIGLYQVFNQHFNEESFTALYSFISAPISVDPSFLNLINLYESSIVLVVIAAILQFFQGYITLPKREKGTELQFQEQINRNMVYLAPLLTLLILPKLPSAVALYWATSTVISIIQQKYFIKIRKNDLVV